MAVSTCPKVFTSFECRSDPDFSGYPRHGGRIAGEVTSGPRGLHLGGAAAASSRGLSSRILRFPPNFVRQLSIKARRNCSNIGVAQIVAASWANNSGSGIPAVPAATGVTAAIPDESGDEVVVPVNGRLQVEGLPASKEALFLSSDGSLSIHAGERLGRGIVTDAITTPVVNTSAYFFKKTIDLIDSKEKRATSFEYGRYGNPTTVVAEEKMRPPATARKARVFVRARA